MNAQRNITVITLLVNRLIALVMVALIFAIPSIVKWYCSIRWNMTDNEQTVVIVAFYCCTAVIFYALWNMDRLLTNIRNQQVFITKNVTMIRRIQWCCGVVSLICVPAAFAYLPLLFLVVIMALLCLTVSVVACVMDAAVSIREENDLTI